MTLAARVKDGIRDAGGIAFEFPTHPIQESGAPPPRSIATWRIWGWWKSLRLPLDGVVLMTGCDKTTPACLMAAATVNLPAIVLSGGPMLDGYYDGKLAGSGMALWEARRLHAEEDRLSGADRYGRSLHSQRRALQHHGHGAVDELTGGSAGNVLPGCAAIPAYGERARSRMPPDRGSSTWFART
jgi:dihydroxy-acid dehydratase